MLVQTQCDACHIGLLQTRRVTYAARLGNDLLVMPNITVYICDVCGESAYDPEIIARIQMLLGVDLVAAPTARRIESPNELSAGHWQLSQRRGSA
jgi:YgiT-type zinc finger domain-containing protein